jgi:hypothetical protein
MTDPEHEKEQVSDKELNFRALESKFQRELDKVNAEKERMQAELERRNQPVEQEDDDESEPYVDHKKFKKTLASFEQQNKKNTQTEIQRAVEKALREKDQKDYVKHNPDFFDVLNLAPKFYERDPELAETILQMPEGFERQKLVYKNIKALGIDKPEVKQPTIQETIDSKRKSPYYQPSGTSSAPYASVGNFSPSGQKDAYAKMQELKNRLRI